MKPSALVAFAADVGRASDGAGGRAAAGVSCRSAGRLEKTDADDPWWDHRIGFDRESLYWLRDEVRRPQ